MHSEISGLISETVVAIFQANGKMLEWGRCFHRTFRLDQRPMANPWSNRLGRPETDGPPKLPSKWVSLGKAHKSN